MIRVTFLLIFSCLSYSFFRIEEDRVSKNDEHEVKAAFIFNFTKFIEWESGELQKLNTFRIGVYKNSPVERNLRILLGNRTIDNKVVEIIRFDAIEDITHTHVIFVPEHVSAREFKNFVSIANANKSLIISEKKGILEQGSCINFLLISSKIKFEINLSAIKNNQLKVSSQLLRLAERIIQE